MNLPMVVDSLFSISLAIFSIDFFGIECIEEITKNAAPKSNKSVINF